MVAYLDNEPLPSPISGAIPTVADVLDLARGRLHDSGRLIHLLRCDDREVLGDEIERVLAQPAQAYERIDVVSAEAGELAADVLARAREELSASFPIVAQAVEALTAADLPKAMTTLARALESWSQVHEAMTSSLELLGLDPDTLLLGGSPLGPWLNELVAALRTLKEALLARDQVLLGDVLRYEMDETLRVWEAKLSELIAFVGQPQVNA
jgi:BMFP domain-containing protein YqiC